MVGIEKYRRSVLSVSIIIICVFFFTECINREEQKNKTETATANAIQFTGSAKCESCHKKIYESHINTAHFHTSEIANAESIKGSFEEGKNTFTFSSGGFVKMEKRQDGFYQSAYTHNTEKLSQRFDIVFGSGTKGQSFATWSGNKLFQLPITYFSSMQQWCNSPGNPNKIAVNRLVTSRCLECHATSVETISNIENGPEEFNKATMVLGVDCEKCHGPGAKHVAFQTEHPEEKKAQFIINPASFTRQQSLDMCTLCHGGRLQKTKPSFAFTAGNKLADYFAIDTTVKDPNAIDVHGNQYGLLASSKCFTKSKTLTCITCHSPHENEKDNTILFSQRCLSCHNGKNGAEVVCKLTNAIKSGINNNCTNCHMPEQPSKAIAVLLQGTDTLTPAKMHTHYIKAYPQETQKILAYIKGSVHKTGQAK